VPKIYGVAIPRALLNALVTPLVLLGVGPRHLHLLGVRGRRSGRVYRTPVSVVQRGSARWLVAPYGERSWVVNARAARRVTLRRGRDVEELCVVDVPPDERAAILRDYLRQVPFTRDFFDAAPDAPVQAFAAEAARHPVFRLVDTSAKAGPVSETLEAT
jgi:deazaflavin-dependent oxidoreductase (nitroreductase family)